VSELPKIKVGDAASNAMKIRCVHAKKVNPAHAETRWPAERDGGGRCRAWSGRRLMVVTVLLLRLSVLGDGQECMQAQEQGQPATQRTVPSKIQSQRRM
jgi:hypothetical protein